MDRYHTTDKGNVPFTAAEETARDTEEAVYELARPRLATLSEIQTLENSVTTRMMREALAGSILINPRTGKTAVQDIRIIDAAIRALHDTLA